jgi:hypothetical protein
MGKSALLALDFTAPGFRVTASRLCRIRTAITYDLDREDMGPVLRWNRRYTRRGKSWRPVTDRSSTGASLPIPAVIETLDCAHDQNLHNPEFVKAVNALFDE